MFSAIFRAARRFRNRLAGSGEGLLEAEVGTGHEASRYREGLLARDTGGDSDWKVEDSTGYRPGGSAGRIST